MTILAVFRSRAQSLDYLSALKAAGVSAQAVSTPKEAGVGCGLSVKFDERALVPFEEVIHTRAGCTVSCHCGPGTLGILFYRK